MKDRNASPLLSTGFIVLAWILSGIISLSPVHAASSAEPDVTIRVGHIDEALSAVDELSAALPGASGGMAPAAMVRGKLMGTAWMDPQRAAVIGLTFRSGPEGSSPDMAAIVPFRRPNPDFAAGYNAIERSDYYLVPLPPGKGARVDPELESALAAASRKPVKRFVSVEIAASRALAKADAQIRQMLKQLQQQTGAIDPQRGDPGGRVSAADAERMLRGLLELARQMEALSFGLDLTRSDIAFSFGLLAAEESEIARLMTTGKSAHPSILGAWEPGRDLDIRFRCMPYDMAAATRYLAAYFGEFYKTMGFDMDRAAEFADSFTGETAGAISMDASGVMFEAVGVVKPGRDVSVQFLESRYIPWLEEAGEKLAQFYRRQYSSPAIASVFVRTENTTVAGKRVVGIEGRIPLVQTPGPGVKIVRVPLRMTVTGPYLLMASDDGRMAELIREVSAMEQKAAQGPLMTMHMDWAGLIRAAAAMDPGKNLRLAGPVPEMGRLVYTVEHRDRRLSAEYGMKLDDIKALAGYFSSLRAESRPGKTGDTGAGRLSGAGPPEKPRAHRQPETEKPDAADSAEYWMEKGGLYLSYGNEKAAIRCYSKALEMEPGNPSILYNLALAHAENGALDKALDFATRAVSMQPDNGRYLYARGWILVLAGKRGQGLEAIDKAAALGNSDAMAYLNRVVPRWGKEKK